MPNPFQEHIRQLQEAAKATEMPVSAPKPAQAADTTADDQVRLEKYRAWKRHQAGGGAISADTAAWMRAYEATNPHVKGTQ